MTNTQLRKLQQRCNDYFSDPQNSPYSIQELCALLGVSFEALRGWEQGDNPALSALARSARQRVAADWEKGRLPAALATYLHRRYCGEEEPDNEVVVTLRVDDGEASSRG